MKLTVLSVAFPFAPVGPNAVGGAEQVLAQMDAALVRSGMQSVVVAAEGSETAGELVPTRLPAGTIDDACRARVHEEHRRNVERALREWPVDVVHMHGIDFHAYLPPEGIPRLVTLHLPLAWYPPEALGPRPGLELRCVSQSQMRTAPEGAAIGGVVENGVDCDRLWARCSRRDYALVLGRICPEKNFHAALEAGKRAGIPVWIGGQVFPYEEHQRYFEREIVPRLDEHRRFLGPVGARRKSRLLSAARCLLLPTLAPETSSLVAMEAMAAGTPVVAYPSGAVAEIVEPGVTGFLVRDEREMAEAIGRVDQIDSEACRRAARKRFSEDRMVRNYIEAYAAMASARRGIPYVA